jgi:tetratricopeptide (TPR) repeat protein
LAKPDFSVLQTRSPAWVKAAGWHLDGNATVVDLETDAESGFKDFRNGAKVVIDVLAPKTDASAVPPRVTAPAVSSPSSGPKGSDAAAATKTGSAGKTPPTPARVSPMTTEPAGPSTEMTRDGAALHFPAAHGHAAAVFTRGETLWIVLDGHPALDAATLLAPLTSIIVKAQSEQSGGAAVLKLVFKAPLRPSVQESEAALNVTLTTGAIAPPEPLNFTRQGADGQTTLTTPLTGAGHVIQLADADAADHLFVVPARPGKGVLTPKRFVEMEALPSAAGIGIVPFTDDLSVQVQDELVTIARPKGLALSAASGANTEPVVQMLTSKQGPAFIDFEQWAKVGSSDVIATERNLRGAVARLPESEGNKARLNLARYLLAQNLAPEALGEIQIIQSVDPKLANDPGISSMKGAAQYMMGRYADARASLSGSALGADPHAALWRGMAEAKLGDFANARHDLAMSQNVLRFYPEPLQTRARLARAETGLAQGDLASANDALDQLSPQLSPRESVEARLYETQLLAAQGHINESVARLRTLEQTDYAPIAAKATFERVRIELAAKKIKPADAIKTLEQLRYRWRGDDLELATLRKLGSLYFAQENWRDGLTVLRTAARNFANSELGRDAQDDMRQAFNDLFLGGKADKLRPVDALALFYDFIDLTPIGREGDEMIRGLSDRLVAVDLLGPAEQLLDHQVKERLDGVARAAVATRLATIYLLDHKPKEALAIINDTRQTRLPDTVNTERRLLEARALAGLKQFETAIDLIADDESPQAGRLRADISWDSGNWSVAGAKAEEVLGDRYDMSGPLLPEERALIMRAAVAYSLAGNESGLDLLRERYGAKMGASPDAKAFAIVSENIDRQGVAFRDLAKQIASIDSLQAFMADFKKQGAAAKTASN